MEVDDTSRNSRNNRKKRSSRRSSILKINMSPVRTALGDIDPNQVQEGTREAKSKRLSKRVSFADTLSVREFLNDNDAHTLGVWNSPHDQKNNEQQAESEVGDDEVVIGPTIQGLDSLLSAPIKDQTEQNTLPASMVLQEDRADCQPKELTMTMDFTQTHGAILTELEAHQATQRSRSSSSESDASIQHDIDEPNPTFIGPSYSCLMPASFNSSTATEPGDSVPRADGMEQTRIFQNDDTTGSMDLTNCYGGLMNSSTSRQTSQKTDTSLFIQSLTKPTQQKSKTNDFLRSLMAPKAGKSNLQSGHSPQVDTSVASFTKESSVLESINTENGLCGNLESKSYVDVNQLIQYRTNMEVGIPSTGIDKENEDHSRLLSAKRSGALELTESAINFTTDEKTQVFANDDQADMDMTECVLSNTPTSPYIPQVGTEERHTLPEDQTRMFNTKDAGMMEITECVGNVVQASFSHDLKQKKIADQTVMFTDGGDAEMDETTPLGQIELSSSSAVAWNQNYKPSFRNKSLSIIQEAEDENISRRNSSVINCTSTSDHKEDLDGTTHRAFVNDFTIGMDFTANGQIIRPKYTSTPFQQTLPKSLCTKDAADDKTSTVDITMCGQFNVTKSENVLGKEISTSSRGEMKHESKSMEESKGQALEMPRNVGEETVEIERTTFVGGLMQQRHGTTPGGFEKKMSASEITTVFGSGEQTGNMELTSCVGGLLQQASQTVQSNVPAAEMTRDFDIGEDTGRMELTSCIGGLGPTNQQKTPMSVGNKIPAVEVTRVFDMGEDTGRMELTSCVGGLVPTNQVKIPMSNRSKAPDVETTTVFGMGEDTGRIELTSCVGGIVPPKQGKTPMSCRSETPAVEATRVFGNGDGTGRMELTSCVGSLLRTNQGKPPMSDRSKAPAVETTTVFGMGEDTGRMELTSCVGGFVATNQGKTPMSDRSKAPAAEMTRVFGIGEDTGKMELTSCFEGLVPTNQGKTSMSDRSKAPAADMTRMFGMGENTGRVELKSCVGGLVSTNRGKTPMSDRSKTPDVESTRVFGNGEDTGRMELTSCAGGLAPPKQGKTPMSCRSKTPAVEMTRVFGIGEDTGRMELTSCVGGLLRTNQGKTPMSDRNKAPAVEMTTVFGMGEDTGRMELTSCVGGFVPTNQGKTPMSEKSKATAADMTRIFGMGENTGGMELTSCVRGLVPTNRGKTPISDKSKTPDVEATRVFGNGEDTGRMELTSCVGGLVPPKQGKTPMSCRSETPAVETTRVFGLGEDTGRMELPSCVGGLLLTNQGKIPMSDRSKASAVETTTVFGMGEDTGRMELTSCVGGLVPTNQGKAPMNRKTPAAEMTRVFGIGDDTGRMELTSCAEGVLQQHNESSPAGVEIKDSAPEITRILGNEIGKMELTSCIENNLLKSKVVEMEREAPASEIQDRESGKVGLTSDIGNVLEKSDITSSHAKMADLINRSNISHIADIGTSILETEMTNGNSSKAIQYPSACTANQSMSVLVTENMAGFGHSEVSSVEDDIIGTDDKDRSAGTFTIKGEDADTFTITGEAESCQQDKCPQEGVPGSKRKQEEMDCLESLSQSKLIKTDSHDTGLVHEGEEESMKGILEELPPDEIEELENLDLTAATTFHENDVSKHQPSGSSDEEACHKSILSKSLQDRTEIDNFSFLDTAKSAGREITVGEFLGNFLIANLTSLPPATNDRRSLMPLLQRSEPNDLAGCLSASCIDVPKCQMYEWAVEYVSQNIEKMEHSVLELTETLHHKEEMKKKMIIGSAEMKGLEKRVQKLHQVCRKGTKTSWKEWKSKMLSSILTSVTERHDHLKKTVESISESVTQMDNDMQELEQYEADLDTAINELESLELPDEQQQQLYTEQHGKICLLGRELEGMRENQAALQKEKELLVIEEERVQSDLIDLEEMRNKREKVDSVAENLQTAYNKCKRLERLSEGKLKEWDDAGCAVAFLYDSLWLRVTYGGAVPSDLKERVVSSVNFESYLESSSAASAHLSHVMVREAVDCEGLLQKYPTTNSLPKMLEELSYVVSHARCFERDIRHVQFWHPVEIHDKKVKVEFSNFRAFAKFSVTFELVPGSYPRAPVKFIFTNKIGDVSEDDVNSVLANVQPGYCYFKRLVQAVDDFIEKRSINTDDSDTS